MASWVGRRKTKIWKKNLFKLGTTYFTLKRLSVSLPDIFPPLPQETLFLLSRPQIGPCGPRVFEPEVNYTKAGPPLFLWPARPPREQELLVFLLLFLASPQYLQRLAFPRPTPALP